ncbi:hypothetical protein COL922a_010906 [Colletotrichum nupharicola]|nr:hypothetical protein COL922a_010906 [Colletotrichum nupharicola]
MENMDFESFDSTFDMPCTSFDEFSDPNLFFDFDACAGPAPDTSSGSPLPSTQPTGATPPPTVTNSLEEDFTSIFRDIDLGDYVDPTIQPSDLFIQRPEGVQPPSTLVLPSAPSNEDKEACSEDIFSSLMSDLSAPGEPQQGTDASLFSSPSTWATNDIDMTSFTLPTAPNLDLDLFTSPEVSLPETKTSTAQTTIDSFFSDLSTVSTGEVPFTFDEEAVSLLSALPPVVSLTSPQSIYPPPFPSTTLSTATTTLQHPQPIAPASPTFIKSERCSVEPSLSFAPSSIVDFQGQLLATPVPSTTASPAPSARDTTPPVVNGKVIKRIPRPAKAKDIDASDWYAVPPATPDWGGPSPATKPLFQYRPTGEWKPECRFSRDELLHYMTERKRLSLPLTIWIQNHPHGCTSRVPDPRTLKCRWNGCPVPTGTILKGFWRVCFDERPESSGKEYNPFFNAGYMHLYCMDRCFDLFEISEAFDMRPDARHFEKEEKNPMAMNRDGDEMVMEYENWREAQKQGYEEWRALCETKKVLGLPTENRAVEKQQKLWYTLTTKHLALETGVRQQMRDSRGGISIDQHRGDLGWYVKKVNERKKRAKAQRDAGSRALARLADCEEIFSEDEEDSQCAVDDTKATRKTPHRKAEDDGRNAELAETNGNKRQRCQVDECELDDSHKRQRRQCRSIS